MKIPVVCPSCGQSGKLPREAIGRVVLCPACQTKYRFYPDDSAPPPPSAPSRELTPLGRDEESADGLELLEADDIDMVLDEPLAADGPAEPPAPEPLPMRAGFAPATRDEPRKPGRMALPPWAGREIVKWTLIVIVCTLAGTAVFKGVQYVNGVGDASTPSNPNEASNKDPYQWWEEDPNDPIVGGGSSGNQNERVEWKTHKSGRKQEKTFKVEPPAVAKGPSAESAAPVPGGRAANVGPRSQAELLASCQGSVAYLRGRTVSGSGFLVRPGVLAAPAHVFDTQLASGVEVYFPSAGKQPVGPLGCEVIYLDRPRDVVFLKVKVDLPPYRFVITDRPPYKTNDTAIVFGGKEAAAGRGRPPSPYSILSFEMQIAEPVRIDGMQVAPVRGLAVGPTVAGGPVILPRGVLIGILTTRDAAPNTPAYWLPLTLLADPLAALDNPKLMAERIARKQADGPSRHAAKVSYRLAILAGALYATALDVHRRLGGSGGTVAVGPKAMTRGELDELVRRVDARLFVGQIDQSGRLRNDRSLGPAGPDLAELCENYGRMKALFEVRELDDGQGREVDTVRTTHRRLIDKLMPALDVPIPPFLEQALRVDAPGDPSAVLRGLTAGHAPLE